MSKRQLSIFEKCARKLCLNSAHNLLDMAEVLTLIVTNCIEHSDQPKYFNLKTSTKILQGRIMNREGGTEFLFAVGFVIMEVTSFAVDLDDCKVFVLDQSVARSHLERSLNWLQSTVETCLDMLVFRRSQSDYVYEDAEDDQSNQCASVIIQIKLPTGQSICGGFMPYDTVGDIVSYVSCYFTADRYRCWFVARLVAWVVVCLFVCLIVCLFVCLFVCCCFIVFVTN